MAGNHELFKEVNWFAILYGQGLRPKSYHPLADVPPADELGLRLNQIRSAIAAPVGGLPAHAAFLRRCCVRQG